MSEEKSSDSLRFPWLRKPTKEQRAKYRKVVKESDWDAYYLGLLPHIRQQSTCLKKGVGAIIVLGRRIISTGYNGVPKGIPHPISCPRLDFGIRDYERDNCSCVHAEQNAIAFCADNGISCKGATLYAEYFPCGNPCTGVVIDAGIARIVYDGAPVDKIAIPLCEAAGLTLLHLPGIIKKSGISG